MLEAFYTVLGILFFISVPIWIARFVVELVQHLHWLWRRRRERLEGLGLEPVERGLGGG